MNTISLVDYFNMLDKHDWFYTYSDDSGVYNKGETNYKNLQRIANQSNEHKVLFEAFENHIFSGSSFGTQKLPKPEKPV